jgi:hypothetical protein
MFHTQVTQMETRSTSRNGHCERKPWQIGNPHLLRGAYLIALLLTMSTLPSEAHECEFVAFVTQGRDRVSDLITDSAVFTNFLKESSNSTNDDGYGVIYYDDDLIVPASQKYYVTGTGGYCYYCGESAVMDTAIVDIQDADNRARIVLGHARNGTGGIGNHPFTHEWNGRTYSFQHNGVLSANMKSAILAWLNYANWFSQFPDGQWGNWSGNPNIESTWIDSELLFHYLMFHIMVANDNVVAGLRTALSEQSLWGVNIQANITTNNPNANPPSVINFVLSDGESLFAFRNSYLTDSNHELSYRQFASGLAGVWTQNAAGSHVIDRYQLAILPPSGSVILFDDIFTNPNGILEAKTYHKGSNWVCFPVLPTANGPQVADFFSPLSHAHLVQTMNVQREDDGQAVWNGWSWNPGDIGSMISTKGYKLNIVEGSFKKYQHLMVGGQRIAPSTQLTLHAGVNYVPYFLVDSQHPSEAFPQPVLDVMSNIEGEYWFMIRRDGEFVVKRECGPFVEGGGPLECYTLEYGAMYQVSVTAPVSFRWNQPVDPPYPYEKPLTVYYDPEKKPDYTPVVIENIEGGDDIVEIAAMLDGVCVGAEVVDGYPVNLQVYADDLSQVTFEAATGGGTFQLASSGGNTAAPVLRRSLVPASAYHENGGIFLNLQQGSVEVASVPASFRIVNAYPNPFNPSTTIRIHVSQEMHLSLGIYNIQGEQLARLVEGRLQAGEHELTWSGRSDSGMVLASGMYYGVLRGGGEQSVQKLLMLK